MGHYYPEDSKNSQMKQTLKDGFQPTIDDVVCRVTDFEREHKVRQVEPLAMLRATCQTQGDDIFVCLFFPWNTLLELLFN